MIREVEVEKICIIYGASDVGNASTTKTHLEGGAVATERVRNCRGDLRLSLPSSGEVGGAKGDKSENQRKSKRREDGT